jgi:hypothetical protein
MRVKTFDDFSDGLDVRKPKNLDNDESLRTLVNAYITQGETIERRPGLKAVGSSGIPEVKNLCAFDGRLHTFTSGSPGQATLDNGVKLIIWKISYDAGKACQPDPMDVTGDPSSPEPSYVNFVGGFLSGMYVSVKWDNGRSLHYFIENPRKMYGSTINPIADSKCPHTSKVAIAQSKIYAVGDMDADGIGKADTVVYSATADYDDPDGKPVWDGPKGNSGFLPTGDRSLGNSQATGLGIVSNRLVVFHEDACQIWAVDPDPARNELEEQVAGIGTEHYQSIVTANKDIYFLSSVGVRSIGGQSMYRNMKGSDVGSAIDNLIKAHIKDHDGKWDGQFYPGAGQYWLTAGDETFVLTKSQRDKLNAWSIYRFSQAFNQMAHLAENLYTINSGYIYMLDEETLKDGKNAREFNIEMETPFYSFGQEGQFKLFQSMEVILEGFGEIDHCVNPNDNSDRTAPFQIAGDTRTVPTLPLGILAPTLSTRIKGKGSELKSINSLIYRYQPTNAGV